MADETKAAAKAEKNAGKFWKSVFVAAAAIIIIHHLVYGHAPAEVQAVTRRLTTPRMEVPPGATMVSDQTILPPLIEVTIGKEWYSPAPDKRVKVWGFPINTKTVWWQIRYTFLDNSTQVVDMDPAKDGEFTWPNRPIKLVEFRVRPDQPVNAWKFKIHLDPFPAPAPNRSLASNS